MLEKLLAYLSGTHQQIAPVDARLWRQTLETTPLLAALGANEQTDLKTLTEQFLAEKRFFGGDDLEPNLEMAIRIAALACLPVLHLGYHWLSELHDLVIYPDAFLVHREERDEFGVVHEHYEPLSGEAWEHGTLVLSWPDVLEAGARCDGRNVVIHEIAHILDDRNGAFNGFPPLHKGMDPVQWTADFSDAFDSLNQQLTQGHRPLIDPYGATSPAEFFAVTSEYHFERPDLLQEAFPRVAMQLERFYGSWERV
ncbi:Inner membrane protein [Marinobacterium lacunae]|uniref:Inner membrane protein n=1 Tax=Marinobacterium lacunae TaxID=1232683 RepID=A0A081FUG2_9GAMM|nr:M90 family metallopeptidase [Marinobacterium lacunae]KEA62167.1 Inner membrane protein [Marinobacterium lacunae]